MPPFTPTASERRGRKRTLFGLALLLLAGAALALSVWPWAQGLAWPAWLRAGAGAEEGVGPETLLPPVEVGGRGVGWWAEALRPQLALVALVLLGLALGTNRRLSAAVATLALAVNAVAIGATPVRGGWLAGAQTLLAEQTPAGDGGWTVLHAHLAGATHLDVLAAEVARTQPEAVTAAGARPGVAQSVTPLFEGYRLAGSRPAAGDGGLAVWVRRDVISGAARPDGPTALAATLERGEDRLRLVVSTGPPPARAEGEDAPLLVLGGFDAPPWATGFPGAAGPKLSLLPPGQFRPWAPLIDHAWADLPAGWSAATAAGPALSDDAFPLRRPLRVRLGPQGRP